ncbi:Contains similarity to YELA protein gb/U63062 from Dictyostelium discoideum [Arabidopsis thaliana]|uniref:At1g79060 n=2 Tax=Arabidopsis thaliana TaxID=3702 RepID=O64545_ARATH|nr:TPRXL [Arabidopsis thaliana]AAC17050.1 Contains similarity to YELA protein gb/U63062 from Dictyostelium discoideum [Arabidopsis thaliana]AAT44972.1 At1g79060 [Arabidopsis thaliana]AAT70474.1 At1g79060 [Arabidopsis thaliana]AEE36199.1 TPRXL [Arabidopsis thaliana]CAA0342293.1 unnamed protein product [Arabidopsis thaliana]|eukprot:NP_178027.1 TPRXL [Arabidopsis thaliana]
MASVCVNNVTVSQDFPTYGCFNPRASFSRDDGGRSSGSVASEIPKEETAVGAGDFEFRLEEDPVGMLPADELFSDGKLVTKQQQQQTTEIGGKCRRMEVVEIEISGGGDNCSFSPKAPRCSSRWRDLLGLKRFSQNSSKSASTATTTTTNPRSSTSSLKQFLHRSSRSSSSSSDASLLMSLPLLKDSDSESVSISSSRMSLSSSSSGHDHEDLPRLSLDAERPNQNHIINLNHNLTANPFAPARSLNPNPPRMRLVNHSTSGTGGGRVGRSPMRRSGGETSAIMNRGVSVDSPRLNSSGKIVFQNLERSSSSPSSFNGGTSGYRHRGMERSYSSNVRVTPVLNVPVCSIRGGSVVFGQFFSSSSSSSSSQNNRTGNNNNNRASCHISRGRNSTDRI